LSLTEGDRVLFMANALVDFKKICSLSLVWLVSLEASFEVESKKGFFRLSHWRFSREAKCLIVVAIVAVLLISVFAFLPKQSAIKANIVSQSSDNSTATPSPSPTATPQSQGSQGPSFSNSNQTFTEVDVSPAPTFKSPGLIQSDTTMNSTVWMKVAANAWAYFQPGVGVDNVTGLPLTGGADFSGFTDSDLGCYIQAIIDAQQLGLVGTGGAWGSDARINMVLTFLENRPLNSTTNYPFQFYNATNGQAYPEQANEIVDVVDTGKLFVALNNLINLNSSLQQRIDNFVYNTYGNRSDYAALVPSLEGDAGSNSIYSYYFISGFASFWPSQLGNVPSSIMNNIFNAKNVTTYGNVSLPDAAILGDPLLCSVFELNNNSSQLMALSRQVYLATEAYYNVTGHYAAFSEGSSPSGQWIYEWNVYPDGQTWVILNEAGQNLSITPIIYTKIAMGFLAIYNTTFAQNMVVYLEEALPTPSSGYYNGVEESGIPLTTAGDLTNSLILDAATYAIQNNP